MDRIDPLVIKKRLPNHNSKKSKWCIPSGERTGCWPIRRRDRGSSSGGARVRSRIGGRCGRVRAGGAGAGARGCSESAACVGDAAGVRNSSPTRHPDRRVPRATPAGDGGGWEGGCGTSGGGGCCYAIKAAGIGGEAVTVIEMGRSGDGGAGVTEMGVKCRANGAGAVRAFAVEVKVEERWR